MRTTRCLVVGLVSLVWQRWESRRSGRRYAEVVVILSLILIYDYRRISLLSQCCLSWEFIAWSTKSVAVVVESAELSLMKRVRWQLLLSRESLCESLFVGRLFCLNKETGETDKNGPSLLDKEDQVRVQEVKANEIFIREGFKWFLFNAKEKKDDTTQVYVSCSSQHRNHEKTCKLCTKRVFHVYDSFWRDYRTRQELESEWNTPCWLDCFLFSKESFSRDLRAFEEKRKSSFLAV